MKRILALLLVLVISVSVFAGCNNEKDPAKTDQTTNTTTTTGGTEPDNTKPDEINPEERQKMWEKVFTEGTYKFASESFELNAGDMMFITCLTDGKSAYVGISGEIEDDEGESGKLSVGLYNCDDGTMYFHQVGETDGEKVDKWYKCVESEDGNIEFDETTEDITSTDSFTNALGSITKIEYIETVDGFDKVVVHYVATDDEDDDDTWTKTVDMTIEFEYNGAKGQYRYYEQTDENGMSMRGTITTTAIEGFEFNDWEFDKDTLTLSKGEESIKCTLITDHLTEEAVAAIMEIYIDAKDSSIYKMVMSDIEGVTTSIEFIHCDNVAEKLDIPEEISEEMSGDDAVMQLAMTMFALALGGASGGIG